MAKCIFSIFFVSFAAFLSAHEFWLEPQAFQFSKGDTARIRFNVGENFKGENWSGNADRVQSLSHYLPDGKQIDLSRQLSGHAGDSLQIVMEQEGTHSLTFNSKNAFINLDAEQFNDYLKEDGLDEPLVYRKDYNEINLPGKEYYQRSVKLLLQCGQRMTTVSGQSDLPLDIIPATNVYDINDQSLLTFRVLIRNLPYNNGSVKLWHKQAGKDTEMKEFRTDNNGEVGLPVDPAGKWMVSCVYMERLTKDTAAQWQSYWGSLVFGYDQ